MARTKKTVGSGKSALMKSKGPTAAKGVPAAEKRERKPGRPARGSGKKKKNFGSFSVRYTQS